ncbi:MAG: NTP transferase domain-containing protein [Fuerstiella sp.]|nr:NTP transferase domain-containing protein [Fuerstiella sp.]
MLHAVIMAGGSGTRFWPQSREKMPKQLLKLSGDRTMIQQTVDRCEGLIEADHSWIVTNAVQAAETCSQLPEIPSGNVLVEPRARNTAPCVGLAAIHALHRDPDATMLIMPADHVISTVDDFQNAVQQATAVVEEEPGRLVMFGITPAFPATGFGYIERGAALQDVGRAFEVAAFHEKPQLQAAEEYVASDSFYWNCGIFCWKAQTILNQLQCHENDTYQRLQRIARSIGRDDYNRVLGEEFPQMNSISIDCAVLERATGATVIESPFSWDDVGSWLAVPRLADQDDSGNTIEGAFVGIDTNDCIVRTSENHLVATLGVSDLIIVQTADATLVAHKRDSERIKELLGRLKEQGRSDYL